LGSLSVLDVNVPNNSLTVMFPGALAGEYFLSARDTYKGSFWEPISLKV
jgi:hypothetical protein